MFDLHYIKKIADLFMKGQHDEARYLLMDMQAHYISMSEENTLLRRQVQEFEDTLSLSRNLVFDGSSYWLSADSARQGPYCPHCHHRNGSLVRMVTRLVSPARQAWQWHCLVCGHSLERASAKGGPKILESATTLIPGLAKALP